MRKRLIGYIAESAAASGDDEWLRLDELAEVEVTSEDPEQPIEGALLPGGDGWRAATPGRQIIRLIFPQARRFRRIRLVFRESVLSRTQEYLLRWSADGGRTFREIVRQQWNFSPAGANQQTELHSVDISAASVLELIITPDIGSEQSIATLQELRLA